MFIKKNLILSAILLACGQANAGISIGTNALAEGEQAIATGKNSIAHGTGAVASGNNLTGEDLKKILADNKAQLNNIESLKGEIKTSEQVYAEKLAIYNKVQSALAKIKENNQQIDTVLTPELSRLNTEYGQFKPTYEAQVADMNDRLSMIDDLDFTLLSTDPTNGLNRLATELKTNVEQGHNFSLDQSFYKDYIKNYIDAAGRLNKEIEVYNNNNNNNMSSIYSDKDNVGSSKYIKYHLFLSNLSSQGEFYQYNFDFNSGLSPYYTLNTKTTLTQAEFNQWDAKKSDLIQNLENHLVSFTNSFMDATDRENLLNVYKQKMDIFNDIQLMKLNLQKYYDAGGGQGNDSPAALVFLSEKVKYERSYKDKITQFTSTLKSYEVPRTNKYGKNYRYYTFFGGDEINALGDKITETQQMNTQTKATLQAEFEKELAQVQAKYDKLNNDIKTKQDQINELKRANAQLNPTATELAEAAKAEGAAKKLAADKKALEDALAKLALNDLRDMGQNAIAIGTNALVTGNDAIGLGTNIVVTGKNAIGIGKDQIVTAPNAIALGHANTVSGEKSIAMGSDNVITGESSIAIGVGHNVSGHRSGTFGDPNTVEGNDSYAFGNNITIGKGVDNVFVLGNNVSVTDTTLGGKGSVVLGSNSTLEAANPTAITSINGKEYSNAGATPDSVVSIGSVGKERQISHVAAGRVSSTSTDAINGSQLFNTNLALNAISDEMLKYDSKDKSVISLAGAEGTTITKVKAGALSADSTDAVNGSQLYATNERVAANTASIQTNKTNIENIQGDLGKGWNIKTTGNTTPSKIGMGETLSLSSVNGNIVINHASENVTFDLAENIALKQITINKSGVVINESGINANTSKIINVSEGTDEHDAVNVKQLNEVKTLIKSASDPLSIKYDDVNKKLITLGGVDSSETSTITHLTAGTLSATSSDAVNGSQLYATNEKVAANTVAISNLSKTTITYDNSDKSSVTFTGKEGTRLSNIRDGVANSDAATVGQLNSLHQQLSNKLSGVEKKANQGAAASIAVASLPQANLAGESMVSMSSGVWRGQVGYAIGLSHASENGKWVFKGNMAYSGNKDLGGGLGVGYRW